LTEPALAAALVFTKELGLASRLGELAIKELGLAKKQFAKLERDAAAIVAQANQTGLDA